MSPLAYTDGGLLAILRKKTWYGGRDIIGFVDR